MRMHQGAMQRTFAPRRPPHQARARDDAKRARTRRHFHLNYCAAVHHALGSRSAHRRGKNGGRLTVLRPRGRLGQGEARLRRRQGAPTCNRAAPPREFDLLTARPYNRLAHHGPRCDRSVAGHAAYMRVDARRHAERQGECEEHGGRGGPGPTAHTHTLGLCMAKKSQKSQKNRSML